jgi:Flp pilus assembly protein TadG
MYLLLKESNRFCRRLLHDDSGVFMALTAIVFLSLFLMGMAILAVGDTVRKRIELQTQWTRPRTPPH